MSYLVYFETAASLQVSTASVSFLASTTVAIMVARKRNGGGEGLSTPYRRLIFGLSVSDMMQSFALATGPWSTESTAAQAPWGVGNRGTCSANGVFLTLGMGGVPIYVCCLSFYYVCKLKRQMTDEAFTNKYERKVHIFVALFLFVLICVSLAMDAYHSTPIGTFCHFAALPVGCRQAPEIYGECIPDQAARVKNLLLLCSVAIPFLSLLGLLASMYQLYWNVIKRERIFQAGYTQNNALEVSGRNGRFEDVEKGKTGDEILSCGDSRHLQQSKAREEKEMKDIEKHPLGNGKIVTTRTSLATSFKEVEFSINEPKQDEQDGSNAQSVSSASHAMSSVNGQLVFEKKESNEQWIDQEGPQSALHLSEKEDEAVQLATLYRKETILQAFLYVGSFCISYCSTWVYVILVLADADMGKFTQATIEIVTAISYPIQGLLNIIVYTRPKVASLRRKYPNCSWLMAFYVVVKEGGEVPPKDLLDKASPRLDGNDKAVASAPRSPARGLSSVSEAPFGVVGTVPNKMNTSIAMKSVEGVDGLSLSFNNQEAAYRPVLEWKKHQHSKNLVLEQLSQASDINSANEYEKKVTHSRDSMSEVLYAANDDHPKIHIDNNSSNGAGDRQEWGSRLQRNGSINMDDIPSSFARTESEGGPPGVKKSNEKDDDIWGQAFKRVKEYNTVDTDGNPIPESFREVDIWGAAFARVKQYRT
uniref:Uncharacterized protein n=1 Tax=Chaetoceros debilis TaxID=122233 RepID=A0A7S3PYL0_9STRA|mmetsp:Transcript_11136/g.16896  ORF Transcript_11136/g.16896 Transcript_11136/m.16896 type:complete len:704 (+) Transcript_11136:183-2294(+)